MSKKITKENLINLSYEYSLILAAEDVGEEFHKDYKKNKRVFTRIVRSDKKLERMLKKHFKKLASETLPKKINWEAYESEIKKASSIDDFITVDVDWEQEEIDITVILVEALLDALIAGGNLTEEEFNIDIGWNATSAPAIKFLREYSLKLAKGVTNTTAKKVTEVLKTSISLGENRSQAEARILQFIDDPKRASMIAQTESVRAFSAGRLEVGREIGASKKEWSTTIGACPICEPLNNKIVGIDELFDSQFDAPPAHPRCRCIVHLVLE